ncbi:LysR substrate-binding domain-containing protein [Burkholderia cepacia]|uniref:LysR substrate-binding domain-containing protein n=1 Tax=Burkholderia cepacia TaxID=292 RepID=UPI001F35C817|nr:LysR substrate-binding domain-containing protein [Burkholderia cepacia]MCE4124442.1 LysR substrate-binding domain-containing protein [Burkholderia cepacia]
MDVKQLRYFAAVVETGSVSKAALKLAISQPSLSQQIASMEDELGAQLLLRSPSGVRPTHAGDTLYRHAHTILKQFEQMRGEVSLGEHNEVGHVAVGLPTSVAAVIAVPLFSVVRSTYPGIKLEIFESMSGYLVELLANGRLDMAILFRDIATRGMIVTPLFNERLSLYGASGIGNVGSESIALAELSGVPLVLPGQGSGLRVLVERAFAREGLALNVVADIDSLPTMLSIAEAGDVGTILSGALGRLHRSQAISRRLVSPSLERALSLCVPTAIPQNAASRAVQTTIQELVLQHADIWDAV